MFFLGVVICGGWLIYRTETNAINSEAAATLNRKRKDVSEFFLSRSMDLPLIAKAWKDCR